VGKGSGVSADDGIVLTVEHFQEQEKHAQARPGVESGFPSENATTQEKRERFPPV
jgi:hypothetical protein